MVLPQDALPSSRLGPGWRVPGHAGQEAAVDKPGSQQTPVRGSIEAVMDLAAARCFGQKSKALLFLKKKKQKDFVR